MPTYKVSETLPMYAECYVTATSPEEARAMVDEDHEDVEWSYETGFDDGYDLKVERVD